MAFTKIINKKASIAFGDPNLHTIFEKSVSLDYLAMHKVAIQPVLVELLAKSDQKIAAQHARAHLTDHTFDEADCLSRVAI